MYFCRHIFIPAFALAHVGLSSAPAEGLGTRSSRSHVSAKPWTSLVHRVVSAPMGVLEKPGGAWLGNATYGRPVWARAHPIEAGATVAVKGVGFEIRKFSAPVPAHAWPL